MRLFAKTRLQFHWPPASAVWIFGVAFAFALEVGTVEGDNSLRIGNCPASSWEAVPQPGHNLPLKNPTQPGFISTRVDFFNLDSVPFDSWSASRPLTHIQNRHFPSKAGLDDDSQEVDVTIARVSAWHTDFVLWTAKLHDFHLKTPLLEKIKPPP